MAFLSNSCSNTSLSQTLKCSICGQILSNCNCPPRNFITTSGNTSAANTYINWPSMTTCTQCGQPINQCSCQYGAKYVPYKNPNIQITPWLPTMPICPSCGGTAGACYCTTTNSNTTTNPNTIITWPGGGISSGSEIVSDFKVSNVEGDQEYEKSGWFRIDDDNKEHGYLGYIDMLYLPDTFKNAFYQIRDDARDLWQILSPILLRIDFDINGTKESRFFSIYSIERAKYEEELKRILLINVKVQEIVSTLELTRLYEIQKVFLKLLRRL